MASRTQNATSRMGYISLINRFWEVNAQSALPPAAALLHFFLLEKCNRQRWPEWFHVSTATIADELGLSRPTVAAARKALEGCGLVEVRASQGRSDVMYRICGAEAKPRARAGKADEPLPRAEADGGSAPSADAAGIAELEKKLYKMSDQEFVRDGLPMLDQLAKNIDKSDSQLVKQLVKLLVKFFDKYTYYIYKTEDIRLYIVDIAREQNEEFFSEYFSGKTDITPLLMQLHSENPACETEEDFKALARLVIAEWEQSRAGPKATYTDWAKHLLAQVRIKNRAQRAYSNPTTTQQHDTANPNRQPDADQAKRKRDESYAKGIGSLLSDPWGPGVP